MSKRRSAKLALLFCAALVSALTASASASAAIHSVRVFVSPAGFSGPTKDVYLDAEGLDPALSTQITVRRAGVPTPIEDEYEFSGSDDLSTYDLDLLEPGDLIEIRQPNTSPAPTFTFQTPAASVNVSGTTVSGNSGGGTFNNLSLEGTCLSEVRVVPLPAAGGAYAADFGADLAPGAKLTLTNFDANGSEFGLNARSAGERACVAVDGVPPLFEIDIPGAKNPKPYRIQVDDLTHAVPNVRVVVRRGGAVIDDQSTTAYNSAATEMAVAPRPGDQIELYRPQTAGAPSQVLTIPQVSGTFDPSVDLATIDAPAGRYLRVFACQALVCGGSGRTLIDQPAGRTFYDFSKTDGHEASLDLQADSRVQGTVQSATEPISFRFAMPLGDLVAPAQSIKLASKLKRKTLAKAFKKGYKVKVQSNEVGNASLTLAFLKSKAGRAVTLAKASKSVAAGTTTVKLKFTKSGKKALKKLRRGKSRLATLTSTVTDASGNTSTLVKRTKIKA